MDSYGIELIHPIREGRSPGQFQHLAQRFQDQMVIGVDMPFHAKAGDPVNLKLCRRGEWNQRMMVETVLSMLPWSAISRNSPIGPGSTFGLGWLLLWRPSTSWRNGMASSPMKMDLSIYLLPSSAFRTTGTIS
jgi:hypothetical protein